MAPVAGVGAWMASERVQHRRHHERHRHAFVLHRVEDEVGFEAIQQDVGGASEERGQKQVAGSVRNRADVHARVAWQHGREQVEPVAAGVEPGLVGVRDAFGHARGATGVTDDVVVVGAALDHRVLVGERGQPVLITVVANDHVFERRHGLVDAGDVGSVIGADHEDLAVGVAEHVLVRLHRVPRVERHPNGAGDARPDEHVGCLDAVVLENPDPVAGGDAERAERIGHAATALPGLGEREAMLARHDGGSVGVEQRAAAHEAGHVHAVIGSQLPNRAGNTRPGER